MKRFACLIVWFSGQSLRDLEDPIDDVDVDPREKLMNVWTRIRIWAQIQTSLQLRFACNCRPRRGPRRWFGCGLCVPISGAQRSGSGFGWNDVILFGDGARETRI